MNFYKIMQSTVKSSFVRLSCLPAHEPSKYLVYVTARSMTLFGRSRASVLVLSVVPRGKTLSCQAVLPGHVRWPGRAHRLKGYGA